MRTGLGCVVAAAIVGLASARDAQHYPVRSTRAAGPRSAWIRPAAAKPTIVLVHGAWADGTGWQDLIPYLQHEGYKVIAVQNPLTSFADDAAATRRVIESQSGPLVVVAHSYGGAVITSAAAGNPNVKSLVYIAAFGPDAGETFGPLLDKFGPSDIGPSLVPDAGGFVTIDPTKYHAVFAGDIPERQTRVMAATQKPLNSAIFKESLDKVAWKSIPSWYVVAQNDRTIKPELERFFAKRMKARTTELKSSHLAFISHAREVARIVIEAAAAESSAK